MLLTSVSCLQEKQVNKIDWEIIGMMPPSPGQSTPLGFAGSVAGVQDDVLMIGGGANFPDSMPWMGGKKKYYDDVYVYIKQNKKLALHQNLFKLPFPNAYAAGCSTPHGIMYAGGESENGISNKSWLMQWDSKTESILFKNLPDLPVAVTNAAATVHGDIIYVAGGETTKGTSDHFFSIDLNNNSLGWGTLPAVPKPVSHSVLLAQSNGRQTSLYLAGGRRKKSKGISDFYASLFEFDLKEMKWKEKKPLPHSICAGTGIAAGEGYLLLFGGDKGETFHKVETIIDSINSEASDSIKQRLIQRKNQIQASHPGFSNEVLLYNTITDVWTTVGNIPFDIPVTTTAVKWGKDVLIPTGEIRAGVRTPQILLGIIE